MLSPECPDQAASALSRWCFASLLLSAVLNLVSVQCRRTPAVSCMFASGWSPLGCVCGCGQLLMAAPYVQHHTLKQLCTSLQTHMSKHSHQSPYPRVIQRQICPSGNCCCCFLPTAALYPLPLQLRQMRQLLPRPRLQVKVLPRQKLLLLPRLEVMDPRQLQAPTPLLLLLLGLVGRHLRKVCACHTQSLITGLMM